MATALGGLRRRILGISPREVTFEARGFPPGDPAARRHLEAIARVFVSGYHIALEESDGATLRARLDSTEPGVRGWAYEGAAMGLALRDHFSPWRRNRLLTFIEEQGSEHIYMLHVGAGWALARLRLAAERFLDRFDPLLRWLVADGCGFHEGFFHWRETIREQTVRPRLCGYARRAFDQGLGRSLWFVFAADVAQIAATTRAFPPERRGDLWSGLGLACAYAGGVEDAAIEALARAAAGHRPALAQGAAFAAKARERAGNGAPHTDRASRLLSGLSAADAAAATDEALKDLPDSDGSAGGGEPAYETWRRRLQDLLRGEGKR